MCRTPSFIEKKKRERVKNRIFYNIGFSESPLFIISHTVIHPSTVMQYRERERERDVLTSGTNTHLNRTAASKAEEMWP